MRRIRLRDIIQGEDRTLVSVPPDMRLQEAARMLAEHRVGTVVVIDDREQAVGILSERDVTRAFADAGADAVGLTVAERMSRDLVICEEREEPYTAIWLMHEHGIRHLPVAADGKLKAIVSSRDVLRYLADHGSPEDQVSLWQTGSSRHGI